jgi:putative inorganic carbon (HCO3(-)) transporter
MRYLLVFLALIPLVFDPTADLPYEPPKVFLITSGIFFFLLVVGFLFLKSRRDAGERTVRGAWQSLDIAVLGHGLALGVSTLLSQDPWTSFFGSEERMIGLYYYLALFVLYFLVRWSASGKDWKFFLRTTTLVAALVSLYAVMQWFNLDLPSLKHAFPLYGMTGPLRAFSTFGHPNFLGAYLAMILPFAVYQYFSDSNQRWRIVALVTGVLALGAIFFTYSRGAWLAALAALLWAWILWKPHPRHWYIKRLVPIFLSGCVLLAVLVALRPALQDLRSATVYRAVSTVDWQRGSTLARVNEWKFAFPYLLQRPFFGYGLDTYYDVAVLREKDPRESSPDFKGADPSVADRLHNIFFDITWASGLVGLLTFLVVLIFAGRMAIRQCRNTLSRPWIVTITASLMAYLVGNLFSFDFSVSGLWFFLLLAGLSVEDRVL